MLRNTMAVGIGSMVGATVIGQVANQAPKEAQGIANTSYGALGLAATANYANVATNIFPTGKKKKNQIW